MLWLTLLTIWNYDRLAVSAIELSSSVISSSEVLMCLKILIRSRLSTALIMLLVPLGRIDNGEDRRRRVSVADEVTSSEMLTSCSGVLRSFTGLAFLLCMTC